MIQSLKGKPVWIFANRPLYGEDDPDDKAQHHLDDYLYDNKFQPSIYIHRGHSYHVRYTSETDPAIGENCDPGFLWRV